MTKKDRKILIDLVKVIVEKYSTTKPNRNFLFESARELGILHSTINYSNSLRGGNAGICSYIYDYVSYYQDFFNFFSIKAISVGYMENGISYESLSVYYLHTAITYSEQRVSCQQ